ncbi:GNAT family N-acetyltransferase [Candidatus Saccharibacteria bacterium]|nr:GNAT family N-acetyltransferase [Candidatus Saccharibacteria bacterium]
MFALGWFNRPEGRTTLLSMGNAESDIEPPTIETEAATIRDFLTLEEHNKQITRMIRVDKKTIGAVWIELFENHEVKPPSIHILIGDPEYRGKGIGTSVMQSTIDYVSSVLGEPIIYSRHLVKNTAVSKLNEKIGFMKDGKPYVDDNGLMWQHIKLVLS